MATHQCPPGCAWLVAGDTVPQQAFLAPGIPEAYALSSSALSPGFLSLSLSALKKLFLPQWLCGCPCHWGGAGGGTIGPTSSPVFCALS